MKLSGRLDCLHLLIGWSHMIVESWLYEGEDKNDKTVEKKTKRATDALKLAKNIAHDWKNKHPVKFAPLVRSELFSTSPSQGSFPYLPRILPDPSWFHLRLTFAGRVMQNGIALLSQYFPACVYIYFPFNLAPPTNHDRETGSRRTLFMCFPTLASLQTALTQFSLWYARGTNTYLTCPPLYATDMPLLWRTGELCYRCSRCGIEGHLYHRCPYTLAVQPSVDDNTPRDEKFHSPLLPSPYETIRYYTRRPITPFMLPVLQSTFPSSVISIGLYPEYSTPCLHFFATSHVSKYEGIVQNSQVNKEVREWLPQAVQCARVNYTNRDVGICCPICSDMGHSSLITCPLWKEIERVSHELGRTVTESNALSVLTKRKNNNEKGLSSFVVILQPAPIPVAITESCDGNSSSTGLTLSSTRFSCSLISSPLLIGPNATTLRWLLEIYSPQSISITAMPSSTRLQGWAEVKVTATEEKLYRLLGWSYLLAESCEFDWSLEVRSPNDTSFDPKDESQKTARAIGYCKLAQDSIDQWKHTREFGTSLGIKSNEQPAPLQNGHNLESKEDEDEEEEYEKAELDAVIDAKLNGLQRFEQHQNKEALSTNSLPVSQQPSPKQEEVEEDQKSQFSPELKNNHSEGCIPSQFHQLTTHQQTEDNLPTLSLEQAEAVSGTVLADASFSESSFHLSPSIPDSNGESHARSADQLGLELPSSSIPPQRFPLCVCSEPIPPARTSIRGSAMMMRAFAATGVPIPDDMPTLKFCTGCGLVRKADGTKAIASKNEDVWGVLELLGWKYQENNTQEESPLKGNKGKKNKLKERPKHNPSSEEKLSIKPTSSNPITPAPPAVPLAASVNVAPQSPLVATSMSSVPPPPPLVSSSSTGTAAASPNISCVECTKLRLRVDQFEQTEKRLTKSLEEQKKRNQRMEDKLLRLDSLEERLKKLDQVEERMKKIEKFGQLEEELGREREESNKERERVEKQLQKKLADECKKRIDLEKTVEDMRSLLLSYSQSVDQDKKEKERNNKKLNDQRNEIRQWIRESEHRQQNATDISLSSILKTVTGVEEKQESRVLELKTTVGQVSVVLDQLNDTLENFNQRIIALESAPLPLSLPTESISDSSAHSTPLLRSLPGTELEDMVQHHSAQQALLQDHLDLHSQIINRMDRKLQAVERVLIEKELPSRKKIIDVIGFDYGE